MPTYPDPIIEKAWEMWSAECNRDSGKFAALFRERLDADPGFRDEFVAYAYDQLIGYITSKFSRRVRSSRRRQDAER
jgi:hypothetical protein